MRLGARYRVLGPVASGGMGSVMLALAKDANGGARPVALKQLHSHLADDARMVEMFVDEARLASRLSHPNVVRVNDVEMIKDNVVLVMDFIEGMPLSALMRKYRNEKRPIPLPVARRIVHDVLLGLHAAHELRDENGALFGVIHRDVSPHNVLLGIDGIARITDFGVAKARGRLANTQADGAVKGKLQYLAPEQIYRKPLDRRVDVFSAGIVLWECLSGRRLFDGESEGETLARVINEPIQPPSASRFDVPLDLDETCLRALERDPKRRWQTAHEFARALEEEGGLAGRAELGALVAEAGAETIAQHRALLDGGKAVPPVSALSDLSSAAVSVDGVQPAAPRSRRSFVGVVVAVGIGVVVGGVLTRNYGPTAHSPPAVASPSSSAAEMVSVPAASSPTPVEREPLVAQPPQTSPPSVPSPTPKSSRPPARRPSSGRSKDAGAGAARPFEPEDL